ncbi:MAG: hypothetical protein HZC28_07585 [Spirochaetes bacterium]|nr:hypothetical protein [Spirochaetota bacterium]
MANDISAALRGIDLRKLSRQSGVWTMIAANVAVAVVALIFHMGALSVIWAFWTESVAIGLLNVIRMLSLKEFDTSGVGGTGQKPPATEGLKVFMSIFFMIHYGFFHVAYAVFLGAALPEMFGGAAVNIQFIAAGAGVLFISNLISFAGERVRRKRDNAPPENIGNLMMAPYARIIPVHLTIILGAFIGMVVGFFSKAAADILLLVLFTTLKIAAELVIKAVVDALREKKAVPASGTVPQ